MIQPSNSCMGKEDSYFHLEHGLFMLRHLCKEFMVETGISSEKMYKKKKKELHIKRKWKEKKNEKNIKRNEKKKRM